MINRSLKVIGGDFTIHRFNPSAKIPDLVYTSDFYWIGKTDDELSIMCNSDLNLVSLKNEAGWKAIKIMGPIAFSETGIAAEITSALAEKGISIIVISTFDSDYIFVNQSIIAEAIEGLVNAGYSLID